MIKIAIRRNLIYIMYLFIYYYLRRVEKTIIEHFYPFKDSLIFTLLMHLGEFFGGLSIYLYQRAFLKKGKNINNNDSERFKTFGVKIIHSKAMQMNQADGSIKIVLLMFFGAFFDFIEYVILSFFIPKIAKMSPTADIRLAGIITISSSLIFTFALKLKIGMHQFYSLIMIGICLVLINIIEFIYQRKVESLEKLLIAYILTYISFIFTTFTDVIEKYLNEFNFLNPMLILTVEASFGILLVGIYSISKNPFQEIIKYHEELDTGNFILLIFLLFLFFVLSAGINVYKILSNVLYTPMAKTVSLYVLNPFLIIYSFFYDNDFLYEGEPNAVYLILNVILAFIIDFFGCVYNEFFILYCFGLEYETHYEISKRSNIQNQLIKLNDIFDDDFDINNDDEQRPENSEPIL